MTVFLRQSATGRQVQEAGKLYPTLEGVHLSEDEWALVAGAMDSICEALAQADYTYKLPLGVLPARTVTVSAGGPGAAAVVCIPPGGGVPGNPEAPLKGIRLPGAAFRVRVCAVSLLPQDIFVS